MEDRHHAGSTTLKKKKKKNRKTEKYTPNSQLKRKTPAHDAHPQPKRPSVEDKFNGEAQFENKGPEWDCRPRNNSNNTTAADARDSPPQPATAPDSPAAKSTKAYNDLLNAKDRWSRTALSWAVFRNRKVWCCCFVFVCAAMIMLQLLLHVLGFNAQSMQWLENMFEFLKYLTTTLLSALVSAHFCMSDAYQSVVQLLLAKGANLHARLPMGANGKRKSVR